MEYTSNLAALEAEEGGPLEPVFSPSLFNTKNSVLVLLWIPLGERNRASLIAPTSF